MSIKKGYKVIAGAPLEPVWGTISGNIRDQEDLQQALREKVGTDSPAFTGTPTAPTPGLGISNNQIATTKFVHEAIETVDALPSQSGQSGKFLTTNGTNASWETVDALPEQSGNSGKFLTTNGTTANWGTLPNDSTKANTSLNNLDSTGQAVINGKVDKSNLVSAHAVIDSYVSSDGLSWYRVYDDGFIMQGGSHIFSCGGNNTNYYFTFPKPFATRNYAFLRSNRGNTNDGGIRFMLGYQYDRKETTRIGMFVDSAAFSQGFDWIAWGK